MSDEKKSNKKLWAGIGVGGFLLLAAGGYTAAYFITGNQVPAKATANGVAIGGMSRDEAVEKLRSELGEEFSKPITLKAGDVSTEIKPEDAGLLVDYEATIDEAGGGKSWNPKHIYRSLIGGEPVDIVRTIDDAKLTSAVQAVEGEFAADAVDATISLDEGKVETTPAAEGRKLKTDETATAVKDAFEAGQHEVEAATETIAPKVADADIKSFQDGALKKAMGSPISLTSSNGNVEFSTEEIGKMLTLTGSGKDLGVEVDGKKFEEATKDDLKKLTRNGPKDASYKLEGGKVVVVPGKSGMVVTKDSLRKAFDKAMGGAERTVKIEAEEKQPEFTNEKAEELKPREVIGEFTTKYPHATYRNTNIGQAAKRVNGTVLMPGETFSMNDTVGERTVANGFAEGYVIQGGNLVKEAGGGVSQAATTLFNAAFFAGFEDVEHKPHSLYFNRYPAGREATLYYGSVDLKFKNNTKYPAIIQGYTDPSASGKKGSVTFKVWSIKTWDKVESTDLVKSDYYSGGTRVSKAHNCEPQAPQQGFTVNYKRLFYKDGKVVKEEPFKWKYSAGDRITCE